MFFFLYIYFIIVNLMILKITKFILKIWLSCGLLLYLGTFSLQNNRSEIHLVSSYAVELLSNTIRTNGLFRN